MYTKKAVARYQGMLSIYSLYLIVITGLQKEWCPSPDVIAQEAECIVDRSPVHHRAKQTDTYGYLRVIKWVFGLWEKEGVRKS